VVPTLPSANDNGEHGRGRSPENITSASCRDPVLKYEIVPLVLAQSTLLSTDLGTDATRSSLTDTWHPLALLGAAVLRRAGCALHGFSTHHRDTGYHRHMAIGERGRVVQYEGIIDPRRGPLSIDKHKDFLPHIPSLGTVGGLASGDNTSSVSLT
jgi:hypothetical protein